MSCVSARKFDQIGQIIHKPAGVLLNGHQSRPLRRRLDSELSPETLGNRREHLPVHNRAFFPSLLCGSFTDLVAPTAKTAGGFLRTYLVATRSRMPAFKIYGTTLQDQVTNMLGVFLVSFIAMSAIPFWQQLMFPLSQLDDGRNRQ